MPEDSSSLREQLDEAIDRVRRELEIIQSPSSIGGAANSRSVVGDLETELGDLMRARAAL